METFPLVIVVFNNDPEPKRVTEDQAIEFSIKLVCKKLLIKYKN